jgi:2-octaprenyl-6-methoxyphenol hydroxylase
MTPDYDVLIIGGGMVGASLACALRPSGLRVAVVEAVPYGAPQQPSYDDRTVALAYGSKRIFTAMGLWPEIECRGVSPINVIHISDRGHFGAARLDCRDAGVEAMGYVVENRVLGAALARTLGEAGNVTLHCPAQVDDVMLTADAAQVQVRVDGIHHRLSARLLVAADGGRSAVREAMNIASTRVDYGQSAIVTNITVERARAGHAYERFTPNGPLALLPMSDARYSVVWSLPPAEAQRVAALDDDDFLRELQTCFGERLGKFTRVGHRQSYPLALTRVAEHVRPRLALVGNAAHTLHPVAGQGFNLGLRDVAVLAQVLKEAARSKEDLGDLAVLRRYAAWRRRDNLAVSTFTDGLVRVFSNSFPPLVAARGAGLLALDLWPAAKRALVGRTMGLAGTLPLLARGLPL